MIGPAALDGPAARNGRAGGTRVTGLLYARISATNAKIPLRIRCSCSENGAIGEDFRGSDDLHSAPGSGVSSRLSRPHALNEMAFGRTLGLTT